MTVRAPRHPWLAGPPDVAALVYVAAVCVWLAFGTPGGHVTRVIGDLFFLPLGLLVAAVAWTNGRRTRDVRTRLAWRLMAIAVLSLWGTGAVYALFDPSLAGTQLKWWVSLLYFPLIAASLVAFPRAPLVASDRPRYLLDLALAIVAGLVLVFFIELIASVHAVQGDLVSRATGAVVEWLAFVASVNAYLRAAGAVQRRVFGAWLAAAVAYMVGNVVFGLVEYRPGHWVDGVWFSAWVFRWIGVRAPQALAPAPFAEPAAAREPVPYGNSAVPYFFLAGGFALLLWAERAGHGFLPLAIGAGVMTALLLLRHLAELRENRRLFAAQLEQQARFRSLVQQSSDVILVLDDRGRATYVSPSAAQVFGPDSGLAEGVDVLAALEWTQRQALRDLLSRRRAADRLAVTLRYPSGQRDLEILTRDLRDDPAVGGVVLTCRDVTDRNELERQLRHAQKLEAVGQLAGGLAHEFNNLLAVIRGSAEGLAGELRESGAGQQALQQIEQCVDRAAALTRKVLTFSRRQAVQATVLDLDQVLTELQPILRQLLPSGIEVVQLAEADGWRIKADQGQVEQVVINLAANARDAMPAGGRVEVRTRRVVLPPEGSTGADALEFVAIDVVDNGNGIAPEVQSRMFEPFFTTKPRDQGSGLGLAMVHGIVTRAGGRIEVRSTPGEGATFTVMWPRTLEEAPATVRPEGAAAPAGRGRSVLLVDDEPGVRHYVQRVLQQHGFKVMAAAEGEQAMEMASRTSERIDVLLTDLVMPGLSGRQLATRFRALRPGVPVVCMTGFAEDDQVAARDGALMSAVLIKPFRVDALLRTLDAVMSPREA